MNGGLTWQDQKEGVIMDYLSVYEAALRVDVINDLEKSPEISKKLGGFKGRFISWCAKERTIFEADLDDEFQEFEEKYIKSRLYNTNLKLWKLISKQVFERDGFTCFYCGQYGGILEVDHYIPISK
ncbi:HNH endonuclease [Cytobacillus horneckiae]|uniref:HNH endonuclease n=2 Tax=Cytobacillus horneckiae TaxID=549687 RepID=A0A2N0ZB43_9BACI|nr:HNH endonuclease [Cytobacillus horneckiae]